MKALARLGLAALLALNFLPLVVLAQTPGVPPPTCIMTAIPSIISSDGSFTLRWQSTNAVSGTITRVGSVAPQGSINLLPAAAQSTTFVGTFTGPGGDTTCQATVQVSLGASTSGGISGGGATTQGVAQTPATPVTTPTVLPPTTPNGGLVGCGIGTPPASNDPNAVKLYAQQATNCEACNLAQLGQTVINFLIGLSIPIAAGLFAYAGVLYFSSATNPGNIDKAKGVFANAFIGFLIAISGWLVINTLLHVLLAASTTIQQDSWFTIKCSDTSARARNGSVNSLFSSLPTPQAYINNNFGSFDTSGLGVSGPGAGSPYGCDTSQGYNLDTGGGFVDSSGGAVNSISCVKTDSSGNVVAEVAPTCSYGYAIQGGNGNVDSSSYTGGCVSPGGQVAPAPLTAQGLLSSNAAQWATQLAQVCAQKNYNDCATAQAVLAAESNGRPAVISPAGCVGLMQICPDTARALDPTGNAGLSDAQITQKLQQDTNYNMGLGVQYLSQLTNTYGLQNGIAAYNGGPRANASSNTCLGQTVWQCTANPGYAETRNYVPKVLSYRSQLTP